MVSFRSILWSSFQGKRYVVYFVLFFYTYKGAADSRSRPARERLLAALGSSLAARERLVVALERSHLVSGS